jgi:hypothetical protein
LRKKLLEIASDLLFWTGDVLGHVPGGHGSQLAWAIAWNLDERAGVLP